MSFNRFTPNKNVSLSTQIFMLSLMVPSDKEVDQAALKALINNNKSVFLKDKPRIDNEMPDIFRRLGGLFGGPSFGLPLNDSDDEICPVHGVRHENHYAKEELSDESPEAKYKEAEEIFKEADGELKRDDLSFNEVISLKLLRDAALTTMQMNYKPPVENEKAKEKEEAENLSSDDQWYDEASSDEEYRNAANELGRMYDAQDTANVTSFSSNKPELRAAAHTGGSFFAELAKDGHFEKETKATAFHSRNPELQRASSNLSSFFASKAATGQLGVKPTGAAVQPAVEEISSPTPMRRSVG